MKKLALLLSPLALGLSLLALGALGLVACGGSDDDETTAASATETTAASDDRRANNGLSNEERIERYANKWAAAFAAGRSTCGYMGQPACERATCKRHLDGPMRLHAAVVRVSGVVCRCDGRASRC